MVRYKLDEDPPRPPPPDFDDEQDHPSLVWLREQWETGNTKKIEEMVELWNTFELLGRIGGWFRKTVIMCGHVLMWFSGLVVAYWAIMEGFSKLRQGQK
ncbi:MAG: hypothetical protein RIS45_1029 [Planctomycetota bacterium]|jgi:hypothetical protein